MILTSLSVVLNIFDNTVAVYLSGTFWEVENEDPTAQYYTMDYASADDIIDYGTWLYRHVEAEGAALLMNENTVLPLASGARVSLFSTSSVNLVYGGTRSGNIDASKADDLRSSLEKSGPSVNETLWDFYANGEDTPYLHQSGGGVLPVAGVVSEALWSVYTYAGYTKGIIPSNTSTYMVYQEGIYVGYKYYETRYEDYVMGAGSYAYHDAVALCGFAKTDILKPSRSQTVRLKHPDLSTIPKWNAQI